LEQQPDYSDQSSVYYSGNADEKRTESSTIALRDFHNRVVKHRLILGASKLFKKHKGKNAEEGTRLIDLAVGKCGDLNKFIEAGLSFVFGVDVSKDNIENTLDGAYERYLDSHRAKNPDSVPTCVFAVGDSSLNIRTGEAFTSDKYKTISRAVFGQGAKNTAELQRMSLVKRVFGWGERGFDICSCQFALHYFAESANKFHSFLRNVSENTRVGGVFICTLYDGSLLFDKLKRAGIRNGDSWTLFRPSGQKMFQITRRYDGTEVLPEDETGLGYRIDVFQDSIGQTIPEYLVHPLLLKSAMRDYGFQPLTTEEARQIGLPASDGNFRSLLDAAIQKGGRDMGAASGLANNDPHTETGRHMQNLREISFLNRYYIFRKTHTVNAEDVVKQRKRTLRAESIWLDKVLTEGEVGDIEEIPLHHQATLPPASVPEMEEPITEKVAEELRPKTAATTGKKQTEFRNVGAKIGRVTLSDFDPVILLETVNVNPGSSTIGPTEIPKSPIAVPQTISTSTDITTTTTATGTLKKRPVIPKKRTTLKKV
jgi:hypothetical protein